VLSPKVAAYSMLVVIVVPLLTTALVVGVVSCRDERPTASAAQVADTLEVDTCVIPACYPDPKPPRLP
jgi:hypothetical protein